MFIEKENKINWKPYGFHGFFGSHYGYNFVIEKMMDFYTIKCDVNGVPRRIVIFHALSACQDYCEDLIKSEEKYVP